MALCTICGREEWHTIEGGRGTYREKWKGLFNRGVDTQKIHQCNTQDTKQKVSHCSARPRPQRHTVSSDRAAELVHSRSTTSHRDLDTCARHRVHQLGLQYEVQGSSTVSQSWQPESLRNRSGSQGCGLHWSWACGFGLSQKPVGKSPGPRTNTVIKDFKHSVTQQKLEELIGRTTVPQTCARSNFAGEVLCTTNGTSM